MTDTPASRPAVRRVVFIHTAGPYVGLRQITALAFEAGIFYLHSGESRKFDQGVPDRLAAHPMWPDGRVSKGMRLKSTPRYILYREECVEAAPSASPAEAPAA